MCYGPGSPASNVGGQRALCAGRSSDSPSTPLKSIYPIPDGPNGRRVQAKTGAADAPRDATAYAILRVPLGRAWLMMMNIETDTVQ